MEAPGQLPSPKSGHGNIFIKITTYNEHSQIKQINYKVHIALNCQQPTKYF